MILMENPDGSIDFYRTDIATDAAIKLALDQMGVYSHVVTGGNKYEIKACIADANAYAINKEKYAKVPPLPYKIGDVIKFGDTDYEIWDISSEPYVRFDDGSCHYSLTIHLVGGSKFDLIFINDAQIDSKEDDDE